MAKSATGKWVSRVGSSGGGKAYKKTRPSNYYGILAVIVVLGLVADGPGPLRLPAPRQDAPRAPRRRSARPGTRALAIQACGKYLPYLATDPTDTGGFKVQTDNVIKSQPRLGC